jgi:hypothetical protein
MASPAEGRAVGSGVARCIAEQALPNLGLRLALRKREGELANGGEILRMP